MTRRLMACVQIGTITVQGRYVLEMSCGDFATVETSPGVFRRGRLVNSFAEEAKQSPTTERNSS